MSEPQPQTELRSIRELRPDDIPAVQRILTGAPEAAYWSLQAIDDVLRQSGVIAFVSERGGQVSGFVFGRRVLEEGELLNLAVEPVSRRLGEGKALVRRLLGEFRSQRVQRVFLEVRESNRAAIHLYEQFQFVVIGSRVNYYRDPTESALVLEKRYEIHSVGGD